MSTTYNGNAGTITVGTKPTITIPVDGDARPASSVAAGLDKLADWVEYLYEQLLAAQANTWIKATNPLATPTMYSVCYNGGVGGTPQWCAVGVTAGAKGIVTSADGLTWTSRTGAGTANALFGVAHDQSGLYVACGPVGSNTTTSADGITWTARQTTGSDMNAVAYNGVSLWVCVGAADGLFRSTTPTGAWTAGTISGTGTNVFYGVAHNQSNLWVAVGKTTTPTGIIYSSPDGTTWTSRATVGTGFSAVAYSSALALWVAVGASGIYSSPDGTAWTSRTVPGSTLDSVCWTGRQFIAAGNGNGWASSLDGITWKKRWGPFPSAAFSGIVASRDFTNTVIAVGGTGIASSALWSPSS